MTSTDVLDAVRRLLEEPQFQDVHFRCSDGRLVSSNRAFLAARCEYFERLLFGDFFKESSSREIRLHASAEAFRHVLIHLHTGHFGSIEQEACWITLMEASSLAQQYILPGMVQHVADRLSADLRPENLGLALSHALKNDLQAVIKSIWVALPRLLPQPFALDRSFSADAICFCLQHTAWMAHTAAATTPSGTNATATTPGSSSAAPAAVVGSNAALAGEASGTAINRTSSINGASLSNSVSGPLGADGAAGALSRALFAPGSRSDSSTMQEAQAFAAVLDWMLQEVEGCADCQATRHTSCRSIVCGSSNSSACRGISISPVATTPKAGAVDLAGLGHRVQQTGPRQYACSGTSSSSNGANQVAGASGASASFRTNADAGSSAAVERSASLSPVPPALQGEFSQPQHPAMQGSRQQLLLQQASVGQGRDLVGQVSSHSVRSSYESDTTEGEADIRSMRSFGAVAGLHLHPPAAAAAAAGAAAAPPSAFAASSVAPVNAADGADTPAADGSVLASAAGPAAAVPAAASALASAPAAASCVHQPLSILPCIIESEAADTAAADGLQEQQQEADATAAAAAAAEAPTVVYSGCCCVGHQGMLLQMLAHLNWHLLEPQLLNKLDSLALLGPAALLEIFRAHQRCCHQAQWGNFPSLNLGGERGLRCYVTGGEQLLECESVSHLTATSNLCFTSGKHCWQFVVMVPCDLVWLGLSDGSLTPDVWGGKQPGGWFYGSNDALCHNKQSDRHAYTKHCGNGKWGEGAVVDVCLDMDAREVWFGVDGQEPKLGFSGLPGRVYPAVSLRAPAQLLVRFRAASWIMSEAQHAA